MIVPDPLAQVVSSHVGIVPRVETCAAATFDARFPSCVTWLAVDERLLDSTLGHVEIASGAGRSVVEAAAAAVGEAVERYSASFVPSESLVHATAAELGREAVAPGRFALFAPSQLAEANFPLRPFHEHVRVPWVRGWDLRNGDPAWLPAELVYLGDVPGAARIGYATSNGTACATSVADAVGRGLCELLERDAFMLVWRARISLPLLEWRGHAKLRSLDDRYFAPSGLRYAAVDLSPVHRLPSVLAVVRSAREPGPLGVGAGTAAAPAAAWWKALSEAFAAHAAACRLGVLDPAPLAADEIVSFDDHIRYYATPDRAVAADFLDAGQGCVDVRDVEPLPRDTAALIPALLDRVERAGSSAYAVDVTAPDIAQLGLRVVKTLAPELCSLDSPHVARFLGGARICRALYELGLAPHPLSVAELNHDPHPFP